jgi:hypothetical protein
MAGAIEPPAAPAAASAPFSDAAPGFGAAPRGSAPVVKS